jgi:hypothetical protein
MNKTLQEMSDLELRAIKGDVLETFIQAQNNLKLINTEIHNRKVAIKKTPEIKEDK